MIMLTGSIVWLIKRKDITGETTQSIDNDRAQETRRVVAALSQGMADAMIILRDTVAMIVEMGDNMTNAIAGVPFTSPVLDRILDSKVELEDID